MVDIQITPYMLPQRKNYVSQRSEPGSKVMQRKSYTIMANKKFNLDPKSLATLRKPKWHFAKEI
jgi:hypothetical protein